MSAMNYRSYLSRVEYNAADRIFVGHIASINDMVGFHGESAAQGDLAKT